MPESSSINAFLAAIGIALATAPIGVFILWKKMAYFGDAISHSSLLSCTPVFIFILSSFLIDDGYYLISIIVTVTHDHVLGVLFG